jgi:peptide/nickel transport system substrate-binding protein
MARRIRWQLLIAAASSLIILGLMGYLAVTLASVARPLAGGEYIEAASAPPQQLNPLVRDLLRDPGAADIQSLIYDGLTRTGVDGFPAPALAQAWEVDASGTVYTFTLRTDVTWHDGTPVTVDDVMFTLRAVQGPAFAGDPSIATVWRSVVVEQVGEREVRCRLEAPYAAFLRATTFPILPAHILAAVPPAEWAAHPFGLAPVGTGPYRLTELTSEHALLSANPSYRLGRPFLDSIELRYLPNDQTILTALTRGEVMGTGFVGTSSLAQINPPRGFVVRKTPVDSYTTLTFNLREPLFADPVMRRALALALDKDALITAALSGQAVRLDTPILPGWWAATPEPLWPAPDPAAAAEALTGLGYVAGADGMRARDGTPLQVTILIDGLPERVAVAQEIARQWGAVGVAVTIEQVDSESLQARLAEHRFSAAIHGWQRLGADPDVYELWHGSQADAGLNYAGLVDEQIDELLDEARRTPDIERRVSSYIAFQRRWVELTPSITLYQPLFIYLATDQLGGLDAVASGDLPVIPTTPLQYGREGRFAEVSRWYLSSSREIAGTIR